MKPQHSNLGTEALPPECRITTNASVTANQSALAGSDDEALGDRLLSVDAVCAVFGIKRVTLWRWRRDPQVMFPAPIRIGHQSLYWYASELRDFLRGQPRAHLAVRKSRAQS